MSKKGITDLLKDCSKVTDRVMEGVENILNSHDITFSYNGDSEIIIEGKSKDEIKSLLNEVEDITEEQMKVLVQVSELGGNVFIRQLMK